MRHRWEGAGQGGQGSLGSRGQDWSQALPVAPPWSETRRCAGDRTEGWGRRGGGRASVATSFLQEV